MVKGQWVVNVCKIMGVWVYGGLYIYGLSMTACISFLTTDTQLECFRMVSSLAIV